MTSELDTKVLLNQILSLVDSHEKSIKDSEVLVGTIGSNLLNKLDSPSFQCGYDPGKNKNVNVVNSPPSITFNTDNERKNRTPKDEIYYALVDKIREVLNSPDKTVTASGPASPLVKSLVDKFLSTMENPMYRTDLEIFEFVKRHESEIQRFIDNDCKDKMISCLFEKIQEINKQNLIYTPIITSGAGMKASSNIESYVEELLPTMQSVIPENPTQPILSTVQQSISNAPAEKRMVIKIPNNEDELQKNLRALNVEVESKFTDLVVDQLDGCQVLSQNVTNDKEKSDAFNELKFNYINKKKSENDLPDETSEVISKTFRAPSFRMTKVSKNLTEDFSIGPSLYEENAMDDSNLIRALDAALEGLEQDIRSKLFRKINISTNTSKPSLFENLSLL